MLYWKYHQYTYLTVGGNSIQTMTEKRDKPVFTGRPLTPFFEAGLLGVFVFMTIVAIKQYFTQGDPNWIWLILLSLTALSLFGLLFNYTNKTLILTARKIRIKKWFIGQSEFNLDDLKGYDLKEEYDRRGIVKNLRIWISDKKHIVFTNGNYRDIYFLVGGLKKSGVPFLGTVKITSKYRNLIMWFMIIAGALSTLGFLLVQILKFLR